MLPAPHRMRRRDEFTAAVRSGRRAGSASVVVHLRAADPGSDAPARIGFVVPRSVGNAVVRNRVKRRLRHLAGDRIPGMPAGARVVVRANPAAAARTAGELAADLDRVLGRVVGPGGRRG